MSAPKEVWIEGASTYLSNPEVRNWDRLNVQTYKPNDPDGYWTRYVLPSEGPTERERRLAQFVAVELTVGDRAASINANPEDAALLAEARAILSGAKP